MNDNIDAYLTRYNGFVQMLPNETFLQITNCESDIAFGANLLVELIDICQEVVKVLAVNENFFLNEFTDINGVKQIAYEFGNIGEDYHQELLFLRLTHTVSDNVWYSSGFFITEFLKQETTRFEYKNNGYFKGISYDVQPYFQSIRLTCFRNDIDPQVESEEYTQISGNKITLRPIITNIEKFIFYVCDFFTYSRLFILLNHDLIYINGYKISNKPAPTKGERIEDTNIFDVNFESNLTEDFRVFEYQIYRPLEVDSLVLANNSISVLSIVDGSFSVSFNKPISLVFGITAELYQNDILVSAITPTASSNVLSLDFSAHTFIANATYTVVIEQNKVFSSLTIVPEYWKGTAYNQWKFNTIADSSCVIPNLISVVRGSDDKLTYSWSTNGFVYGLGTAFLEYSVDSGTTWINANYANPDAATWVTGVISLTHGTAIKYRIRCYGNGCDNQISNVITTTF